MKNKLFSPALLSIIFFSTQPVFANTSFNPDKCPGINAIQSVDMDVVEAGVYNTWMGGVISNNYDTNESWTFVIAGVPANNEAEARINILDSLQTLTLEEGPIAGGENMWGCLYHTDQGYRALTISPPLGLRSALHKIK